MAVGLNIFKDKKKIFPTWIILPCKAYVGTNLPNLTNAVVVSLQLKSVSSWDVGSKDMLCGSECKSQSNNRSKNKLKELRDVIVPSVYT